MALLAALGTGAAFSRELVSLAAGSSAVTEKMVHRAEWLSGIAFDADERRLMLDGVNDLLADVARLREVELDNSVPPAVQFRPPYEPVAGAGRGSVRATVVSGSEPATDEDLAFASVPRLASLLRQRKISSAELTRLYLDRLGRFDPELHCVIHLVEEAALDQARRADEDLAAGRDRGPLHGIPWGAKDLLAVPGTPTTWGAGDADHVGRQAVSGAGAPRARHGGVATGRGRGRAGGQVDAGRPGLGRRLVRRQDT